MTKPLDNDHPAVNPAAWEQELAGEIATQAVFLLTRARFRELEWSEGLTQSRLAEQMGITRAQVSRWLSSPSNMTLRTASRLLMAMGRQLTFSVSDPFAVSSEPPLTQTSFELDPDYALEGLRVPLRSVDGGAVEAPVQPQPTVVVYDWAAARAKRDAARQLNSGANNGETAGSNWKLAAKRGDSDLTLRAKQAEEKNGVSGSPKPNTKTPQWLGEVATGAGTIEFFYLNHSVMVYIEGAGQLQTLYLGGQSHPLSAVEGEPNAFHVGDLTRRACMVFIGASSAAPEDHRCSWI